MKHFPLLAVTILLVFGVLYAYQYQQNKKAFKIDQQIKIEKSRMDSTRNDTVFLGFRLGMTKDEQVRHLTGLILDGKVFLRGDNPYYKINLNPEQGTMYSAEAEISFMFNDMKLYGVLAHYKMTELYNLKSSKLLALLYLRSLLSKKYGYDSIEVDLEDKFFTATWMRGNRKIYLFPSDYSDDVIVAYTDWRVEDSVTDSLKDLKIKKAKEQQSDL